MSTRSLERGFHVAKISTETNDDLHGEIVRRVTTKFNHKVNPSREGDGGRHSPAIEGG